MDHELRTQILNEAIRIGDELLSQAEQDANGMFWKTMAIDFNDNNRVFWRTSEVMYNGVSGIVLFLLELYKTTEDEKYLHAAVEGMRWTEQYCQANPTNYYAFYSGRMGVAYCMLKMAEVIKTNEYLEKSLKIAQHCSAFLDMPGTVNDLLNGTSGTILGLLHLHAATGEKWILATLDAFIRDLIEKAHHGPVGLYWDRSHQNIRGLCGFSHGAAGIGFVFLELGNYFNNEAFYWVAEQAFAYESHFYNAANKNWPDFRKGIWTDEDYKKHEKAFLEGDLGFFTKTGDLNAWCHGAAGIGLSRLRAFALLKKKQYEQDIVNAVEKTRQTDIEVQEPLRTYTLCHGSGGNAEVFLEAYKQFEEEKYLDFAEIIARNALKCKKEHGVYLPGLQVAGKQEAKSLFMGNAGIGYFYLKLLKPFQVASILAPKIEQKLKDYTATSNYPYIAITEAEIKKMICNNLFRRTIHVSEKLFPIKLKNFFQNTKSGNGLSTKDQFVTFIENTLESFSQNEREFVSDVFALELQKVRMDDKISSCALLHIKEAVYAEQAKKLINMSSDKFLNMKFVRNPEIEIRLTGWQGCSDSHDDWKENRKNETEKYPVMLKPAAKGIVEEMLSPFSYAVLTAFDGGNCVRNAIEELINAFESVTVENNKAIEDAVLQQIKRFVSSIILQEWMP